MAGQVKMAPAAGATDRGYSVGTTLVAVWMGQTERTCVVIDKKAIAQDKIKYYVHWHDFNRRMDEWINEDEIVRQGTEEETKQLQEKHAKEKEAHDASSDNSKKTPTEGLLEGDKARTRGQKRKNDVEDDFAEPDEHDEHEGMDAASIREHEEVTKVKNVRFVEIGKHRMAVWYFSPFPKEFIPDGSIDCLYFCEFCFTFFRYKSELRVHRERVACPRHPPGNEIYRHDGIAVFEVDGAISKPYCQNLCYFAKLFLDHKTLYYDVDPFLFYILCEIDARGFHPVGYFSKEKYSELGYNLACILTFPCHQRKGYGNFIIQFSYELSKKEEKVGSPEKPLSDLGLVSYRSYWTKVLLGILKDYPQKELSVMDLTKMTSIKNEDVIATLQYLNIIKYLNGQYVFALSADIVEEQLNKVTKKGPQVCPEHLHWAPLQFDIKRDKWSLKAKHNENEE
ncbi:histone acetyltransferase ESA1 [Thraustotheca clavata]|uniref:histone acetyltransferase n=1 Tax=Thraustotheca clavata TaxID=74557 RepID=A0A1V9Z308_9STRA|nr:histone acetyltransferase ESA1 [Thraustotheca clavata]